MSSLPKLESAKYTLKLPSTGKDIEFRPFLVKEEKQLLLAQQAEDEKMILNTVLDVVRACTFEKIDVTSLKTYDLEKIFIELRAKSVGETFNIGINCKNKECKETNEIEFTSEDIELVEGDRSENKFMINETVGVTLRDIDVKDMTAIRKESAFGDIIADSIQSIFNQEKVWDRSDMNRTELDEFVESLPHKAAAEITKWIEAAPKFRVKGSFKCKKCGTENEYELDGLMNFFG